MSLVLQHVQSVKQNGMEENFIGQQVRQDVHMIQQVQCVISMVMKHVSILVKDLLVVRHGNNVESLLKHLKMSFKKDPLARVFNGIILEYDNIFVYLNGFLRHLSYSCNNRSSCLIRNLCPRFQSVSTLLIGYYLRYYDAQSTSTKINWTIMKINFTSSCFP